MFLSVKEMEVKKVRFDETFLPGQIDFTGEYLAQGSPLRATGSAELVDESEGQIRVTGKYSVVMESECDRCLSGARFPLSAAFDLFYRPDTDIAAE